MNLSMSKLSDIWFPVFLYFLQEHQKEEFKCLFINFIWGLLFVEEAQRLTFERQKWTTMAAKGNNQKHTSSIWNIDKHHPVKHWNQFQRQKNVIETD